MVGRWPPESRQQSDIISNHLAVAHSTENRTYDATNDTAFRGLLISLGRHIFHKLMGKFGDWQCLQPDLARTSERGKEDTVPTEDHVLYAGDALDLKAY